jgi:hypothetical protein
MIIIIILIIFLLIIKSYKIKENFTFTCPSGYNCPGGNDNCPESYRRLRYFKEFNKPNNNRDEGLLTSNCEQHKRNIGCVLAPNQENCDNESCFYDGCIEIDPVTNYKNCKMII